MVGWPGAREEVGISEGWGAKSKVFEKCEINAKMCKIKCPQKVAISKGRSWKLQGAVVQKQIGAKPMGCKQGWTEVSGQFKRGYIYG